MRRLRKADSDEDGEDTGFSQPGLGCTKERVCPCEKLRQWHQEKCDCGMRLHSVVEESSRLDGVELCRKHTVSRVQGGSKKRAGKRKGGHRRIGGTPRITERLGKGEEAKEQASEDREEELEEQNSTIREREREISKMMRKRRTMEKEKGEEARYPWQ